MLVGREGVRAGAAELGAADAKVMQAFGIDNSPIACSRLHARDPAAHGDRARGGARRAVFLFDEPNSALTDEESDELFREMHELAAGGRIVLLVTHRLGDLLEHAGRVAVIRDGRVRAILEGEALSEDGIARQLVVDSGADAVARGEAAAPVAKDALLILENWSHGEAFRDIDLSAAAGEIVALVGVEGSGARDLLRSLAGLEPCSGRIEIAGRTGLASRRLSAYVPATRAASLYSNFSVGENLLVRLGKPDIAGFGLTLKKQRCGGSRSKRCGVSRSRLPTSRRACVRCPAAISRRSRSLRR